MEIDFLDKFLIFFALKLFVCVVLQKDEGLVRRGKAAVG
jgi:hypothetical protein